MVFRELSRPNNLLWSKRSEFQYKLTSLRPICISERDPVPNNEVERKFQELPLATHIHRPALMATLQQNLLLSQC
jgi:hypothetical protein